MKRIFSLLLLVVLVIVLSACATWNSSGDLEIILNGKKLDVYTMHYGIHEEYASFPLTAFLRSIGAEYADPPENNGYNTECYSLMGKRYVIIDAAHLFILEADYYALIDQLGQEGKCISGFSYDDLSNYGLLPFSESKIYSDGTYGGAFLTDHVTLMNALIESGIDITIEYDYLKMVLDVILMPQADSVH